MIGGKDWRKKRDRKTGVEDGAGPGRTDGAGQGRTDGTGPDRNSAGTGNIGENSMGGIRKKKTFRKADPMHDTGSKQEPDTRQGQDSKQKTGAERTSRKNPENNLEMSHSLNDNLNRLQEQLKDCDDLVFNNMKTADGKGVCMIFVSGLIDKNLVQRDVIPALQQLKDSRLKELEHSNIFPTTLCTKAYILEEVIDNIFRLQTVVLIDGLNFALCFTLNLDESRDFDEPDVEKIMKGQHDGFVESVPKNIALIRSKIASSKLKVKISKIGKRSNAALAILYMEDIANPEIVKRVEKRLSNIETDAIIGVGYIDQLTADRPYSLFPQYQSTERPDRVVANLMEGRIAIMADSTPVTLIVPVNYFQFFQTPDDYNINFMYGSFIRLLRFIGSSIAILLPAFYIALLSYHYQAVPLNLLVPLAESRSRVPFPPIIEALIMEVTFELLREASIRLPSGLGPTVGIVGGIVIGSTAIQAGIVSNVMVIVVGITAIATFVVPQYDMALFFRVGRFLSMISASVFGAVGIIIFMLIIFAHLVTLESYGQPYFQPLAPFKLRDLKDILIRVPLSKYGSRPGVALPQDRTRGRGNRKRG